MKRFFFIFILSTVWIAAGEKRPFQAPSTAKMAQRLAELAAKVVPMENQFQNDLRAERLKAQLDRTTDARRRIELLRSLGTEYLNAGQSQQALDALAEFESLTLKHDPQFFTINQGTNKLVLRLLIATAHLRIAEQENCLANHTTDSCLFPIRDSGVHKIQRGSRKAIEVLHQILDEFSTDLSARWLLNVAYMTVGEYPDKVPARWLIPPSAFASDYDIKRFVDVAGKVGLDNNELSGGAIMDDFDNDGYLDIINSSFGLRDQLRYFRNQADGTFMERTAEAGLLGEVSGLNLIQADYNNDGFLDFFVLRGAWLGRSGRLPKSLLRNNGDGTFTDVTEEAGLLSLHATQTAVWFDYNNDGWLDLYVGHESTGRERKPCELYRNNGDGTFTEFGAETGLRHFGFVKGVASGDFNNDGRIDIYVSKLDGPNLLFRNDGPADPTQGAKSPWRFTNVARQAGVEEPLISFPTWFFDFDNDGWEDLFVVGYKPIFVSEVAADYLGLPSEGERARLYRNNRDGTFTDVSKAARVDKVLLGMGCNFGDLDSDGWLDFYVGTGNPDLSMLIPNRMFRNAEGKFFQDVTTSGGFGHLQKGHGVAFGDIDHDGDQDIFEDMGGAFTGDVYRNALFENPGHDHHWVSLKLEGVRSNRSAIGAKIKVVVGTDDGKERAIFKTVSSGGSFGCSPLRQDIGLGKARAIRRIEIFWPVTAKTQVIDSVPMNGFYRVKEGEPDAVHWPLKRFKLGSSLPAH